MQFLLIPPVAFLIYFGLLYAVRRGGRRTPQNTMLYGSGEEAPEDRAAPGYRSFLVFALFFAALHLGALVLASSTVSTTAWLYLIGLGVVLLALLFE